MEKKNLNEYLEGFLLNSFEKCFKESFEKVLDFLKTRLNTLNEKKSSDSVEVYLKNPRINRSERFLKIFLKDYSKCYLKEFLRESLR